MCEINKEQKAIETVREWSYGGDIEDSEFMKALEIVIDKAASWVALKQSREEEEFVDLDDFKVAFEDIEWFYGPKVGA
jgi:hypothetical protein